MSDDRIEREIQAVNDAFYRAFRDRDYAAMEALWARAAPIACMHPGMGPVSGRSAVLASWRGILGHPGAPTLQCSEVRVHLLGTSAFVTCFEGSVGESARLVATNVLTLEEGRWRLVHHQAGPLSPAAAPLDAPPTDSPDPSTLN